jgi:hypothetical protein
MGSSRHRGAVRLDVGNAIHDGWTAFGRSPGAFVGYAALLTLLQLILQPLQERLTSGDALSSDPADWILGLIGLAASILVSLWGTVGLVRGSVLALGRRRVRFAYLLHWDGSAVGRLFLAWLLLAVLLLSALAAMLLVLWGAGRVATQFSGGAAAGIDTGLPMLVNLVLGFAVLALAGVFLILLIYLSVNQLFLPQIAILEARAPLATLQRGRRLVDPQWILVMLLSLIELVLLLLGALLMVVGLLVAWPVVTCISTAAHHQLARGAVEPALAAAAAAERA